MSPTTLTDSETVKNEIQNEENVSCDASKNLYEMQNPSQKEIFNNFYEILKDEAPYLPADSRLLTLPKDIPWVDPNLLTEGRQFVKENYFFFCFVHTLSLLLVFCINSVSVVMMRTGKFHKANQSTFMKIFSTSTRIIKWYEDDILLDNSETYKSIQYSRRMHLGAAKWRARGKPLPSIEDTDISEKTLSLVKAIKEDLQYIDTSDAPQHLLTWTPEIEFSQWDNVLLLWVFSEWPLMVAKIIGIGNEKSFEAFRHMWAVFGRLLGIEDRYNISLHFSPEISKKILINVVVSSLKDIDLTTVVVQENITKSIKSLAPYARFKPLLYCSLKYILNDEFEGKNLYQVMAWYDKMLIFLFDLGLWFVVRFSLIRRLANWIVRSFIDYNVKIYLPKLAKQYQ